MFKRPFGRECSTEHWTRRTAHLVARLKPAPLEDWQLEESKEGSKDIRAKKQSQKGFRGGKISRQAYLRVAVQISWKCPLWIDTIYETKKNWGTLHRLGGEIFDKK